MPKNTKNNSTDEIIQILEFLKYDGTLSFINIDPEELSELHLFD
ncbi:MAG: hypothetical protein ACFE95_04415 [Candidatus Hodarchaeota archaeon]